jgi:hypothetical protein
MSHQIPVGNPFMLMLNPEVVLAAMEKSPRLNQLNRHLCRPLDRPTPMPGAAPSAGLDDEDDGDEEARPASA